MTLITASRAIIERLAEEDRRVLSDWRAALLLRRATAAIPADRRRWAEAPRGPGDVAPVLRHMVARGELRPIDGHRSLYEVTVPYAADGPVEEDEVLMEIHPYAALGHLSALAFHALTDALPKRIMAVIPNDGLGGLLPPGTGSEEWEGLALAGGRRPGRILGRPVDWARLTPERFFGVDLYRPRGYPVRVTTPERTLLDGLLHPDLCGGLQAVLDAWRRARDLLNLDAVTAFVDRFGVAVLRQRVGFILDELELDHPAVAAWPALASRGGSSKLLGSAPYAPTYSERWNLSINAPIAALRGRGVIAGYPVAFDAIAAWAADHGVGVAEARTRYAQYAILRAIANSRALGRLLVFKGGNALDFIWQPNRSTRDLDFSADPEPGAGPLTEAGLEELFGRSLDAVGRRLGMAFAVHRVEQQPPGLDRTFITYEVAIGYALPDEAPLRERMAKGRPSTRVIPVEISLNEPICAAEAVDLDGARRLRVCTLEDIVAEKLRALLQQPIRNRTRPQDLLDIAVILRRGPELDRARVAEFLTRKAAARAVPVSRAAFRHPEVAARARQDYAGLRPTTRALFIPVEEALAALYGLVDGLDIPESVGDDPSAPPAES